MTITIQGTQRDYLTITCTTQSEVDAVVKLCRVTTPGLVMRASANKREYQNLHELARSTRSNGPAPQSTQTQAPARHRILVGASYEGERFSQAAPKTVVVGGRTLNFDGYGKIFSVDSSDNSAHGIPPHFTAARYAYYR